MSRELMNSLRLEVKSLSETGEFTGYASIFGNVDLGADLMEKGAFTKTIQERGSKVRLLDNHGQRIGVADVKEDAKGLEVKGLINLGTQAGKDAYSDLKFYEDQGMPMGMSIGYKTVKADRDEKGIRHIREVKLWEVTVTEFPMNEAAAVTSVKSFFDLMRKSSGLNLEKKDDFLTELAEIQLRALGYQMFSAIQESLYELPWSSMSRDQKLAAAQASLQQFCDTYLQYLPTYLDYLDEAYGLKNLAPEEMATKRTEFEAKSAAVKSAEGKPVISLPGEAGTVEEKVTTDPAAATTTTAAETKSSEPIEDHSTAESLIAEMLRSLRAA